MNPEHRYDVIIVGAGHAGCEAAFAAAKMGCRTLLLTLNYANIAFMPCNPSIGGPAKGHLVREIDALGGIMGRIADQTYLQMKLLNTQKGPAVWALRAQADKQLYQRTMIQELERQPNLTLRQAEAEEILLSDEGRVRGVRVRTGLVFEAGAVVLATGTFLKGRIFIGKMNYPSGPMGQLPAVALADHLAQLGFSLRRFKTGTPARVRRRSIDFSKTIPQPGGYTKHGFSFWQEWRIRPEHLCWLTYTNAETHRIIREHLHEAALYTGDITGIGPRYCPSIESKLIQFPDKDRHQVFIEPEGADSDEMYLAGLSTSLPEHAQERFLRTIPGLEAVEIVRPGYAIEYDALPASQLTLSLESRGIPALFSAGQINGSSGYEEAAAQGLIAGINAALSVQGRPPFTLNRSEAYIGVLIDDLITKETIEPYRVLTSRAEFRLTLRSDTADQRLASYGVMLGMLNAEEQRKFAEKYRRIDELQRQLEAVELNPGPSTRELLASHGITPPDNRFSLAELLKRPEVEVEIIAALAPELEYDPDAANEVAIRLRYAGYLEKERQQAKHLLGLEQKRIPDGLDFNLVPNLAREAREKLNRFHPATLGQASRISGINPADLTAILFYLETQKEKH